MGPPNQPTKAFLDILRECAGLGENSCLVNLVSKEALDELAASEKGISPRMDDQSGRTEAIFAASRGFSALLKAQDLDWQAVRDGARTMSEQKRERLEMSDAARKETELLPVEVLGESRLANFVRLWSHAWSSRKLELLLSLFCDDGEYRDLRFDINISGKAELRQYFATVFHKSDLSLEVKRIGLSDPTKLEWVRRGARLLGVSLPRQYEFWGQSGITFTSDRILSCEDQWDVGDGIMYVLMNMKNPGPPRQGGIVVNDDRVIIDGVSVPRRKRE
jgi:hypothetical protein